MSYGFCSKFHTLSGSATVRKWNSSYGKSENYSKIPSFIIHVSAVDIFKFRFTIFYAFALCSRDT